MDQLRDVEALTHQEEDEVQIGNYGHWHSTKMGYLQARGMLEIGEYAHEHSPLQEK